MLNKRETIRDYLLVFNTLVDDRQEAVVLIISDPLSFII